MKHLLQRHRSFVPSAALLLLCILLSSGCLERIDIPIPKGFRESIAIEGQLIYGDPAVLRIKVAQLFSFTSRSRGAISTGNAILEDSEGNEMSIKPRGTGLFIYTFKKDDPVQVRLGSAYKVRIVLIDGREYESTFEVLQPVAPIEYVSLGISTDISVFPDLTTRLDTFLSFFVNTDLKPKPNGEKSFLRWEYERVAKITDNPPEEWELPRKVCYVWSRIAVPKTRVYAGPYETPDRLNDHEILKEYASRFYREGQYFTVWQESLSEGAYQYWEGVRKVSEEVGDFFGPPPGKVKSNFSNPNDPEEEVFGYFYATQRDSLRFYIDPEVIWGKRKVEVCPMPVVLLPDGSCPDEPCCDCLSEKYSTTTKPDYWID